MKKIILVHDWFTGIRGGEKVLLTLAKIFPEAPILVLLGSKELIPKEIQSRVIISYPRLSKLKISKMFLLPFLPFFIEQVDVQDYKYIISTSSCVAKGIIPSPEAYHICYIHSPLRYVWDKTWEYQKSIPNNFFFKIFYAFFATFLRQWDSSSSNRVDQFLANSSFIKKRVKKYYGRDSIVLPPPVEVTECQALSIQTSREKRGPWEKGSYYVCAGALVGYKRFDLAIKACQHLQEKLLILGNGPLENKISHFCDKNTKLILNASDEEFWSLIRDAKALLFPGIEDFGMVAVEALALGTPVLAYGRGGAKDFIKEGINGWFFHEPTPEALIRAIKVSQTHDLQREKIQETAWPFRKEIFQENILHELKKFGYEP